MDEIALRKHLAARFREVARQLPANRRALADRFIKIADKIEGRARNERKEYLLEC
jgi:hypothetical protein